MPERKVSLWDAYWSQTNLGQVWLGLDCPKCGKGMLGGTPDELKRPDDVMDLFCEECGNKGTLRAEVHITYDEHVPTEMETLRARVAQLEALREALGGLYSHNTMIVPSCLDDPRWVAFTTAWAACEKAAPAQADEPGSNDGGCPE